MSAYRAARTPPRKGRPVLAVGLIVIVAVVLGFLLGLIFRDPDEVGQESPSASPSASVPASGSAAPSASPPASASPGASAPPPVVGAPDGLIPPGSAVRVQIDGLRMRESPSTASTLVENLAVGRLLAVGYSRNRSDFGPVEADGFAW